MVSNARPHYARPARYAEYFVAVALAALISGVYFAYERREALDTRYTTMAEVLAIKARTLGVWLKERRADLDYFTGDPEHLRRYARLMSGDAAARAETTAELLARVRRGKLAAAKIVLADGRVLLRVPDGTDDARLSSDHLVLSGPIGPGARAARLVFYVPWDGQISDALKFWPAEMKTTVTTLVHAEDGRPVTRGVVAATTNGPSPLLKRALRGERSGIDDYDERGVFCNAVAGNVEGSDWLLIAKSDRRESVAAAARRGFRLFCFLLAALASLTFYVARGNRAREAAETDLNLLGLAVMQMRESVVLTNAAGAIIYVNPAFTEASGYSREEVLGKNPRLIKSGLHDAAFYSALWATLRRGETWRGRIVNRHKDGHTYEEDVSISPVADAAGVITNYVAVKRDVSLERSLEDQLRQSQKMEAIGRLAGGVAHDFNNILTSILGYAEIAASSLPPDSPLAEDLGEIARAGKLAAALTRQLLTFSRKQVIAPATFDLNLAVAAIDKMLRRTLPESVERVLELAPEPVWIHIDPAQVDQILLNLAVNASDAMPEGGRLRFSTAEVRLTKPLTYSLWTVPPGRYARLSVIDSGHGIPANVMEHIFEPFFTTKEKGRGTGLGLATVFGIVKQAQGHIIVDSAPGWGTLFAIYLPLAEKSAPSASAAAAPGGSRAGTGETVAVVEDQETVLRLAEKILTGAGYRVLPFSSSKTALAALASATEPIHLLLSDVVMPEMGGSELAAAVRALRPRLPVLFMSGYTDEMVAKSGVLEPDVDLIQKPFTPEALLTRVRAALTAKV